MNWRELAAQLFGADHDIAENEAVLTGTARLDGQDIAIVGTTEHVAVGVETALAQAGFILDTIAAHPGRPILILVDTQGQRLRHRDEMLGINRYMAHLGKSIELARMSGHRVIGLVYDQALSGGFITSGLMADACHALPDASIRVMGLPAMARITKVSEDRLTELAQSNPVFAPGAENYLAMGGVASLWRGDLAACLREALGGEAGPARDLRSQLGAERGGRRLAANVAAAVASDDDTAPA
ncbi:biotin-independent malonate decarboxylase subunit gamma [Noviherbaspirillum pedocola]|uniref:Biotin-independent malonate decarboxylase subunit gamma n=1 Tax=Noviherbaspirillum pedocola TaxID=2801341 RepID=A0A934W8B2_9BURK|nr:biotin-independent malonate decarboxylase subunit gamma [Noviherbaspirillum pedocola]MBK4735624.1 biotin-independent malonate decarboxylase subunit gamma [Noviherbaspirillum pedocola]